MMQALNDLIDELGDVYDAEEKQRLHGLVIWENTHYRMVDTELQLVHRLMQYFRGNDTFNQQEVSVVQDLLEQELTFDAVNSKRPYWKDGFLLIKAHVIKNRHYYTTGTFDVAIIADTAPWTSAEMVLPDISSLHLQGHILPSGAAIFKPYKPELNTIFVGRTVGNHPGYDDIERTINQLLAPLHYLPGRFRQRYLTP